MFILPRRSSPPPQHTPARASRYFLQALDGAQRKSFDAAGAMCRKAIEAAIYEIDASLKGSLVTQIDALSAAHKLTPD
ncbi:MAG: hypothetical protein JWQ07_5145 [Ramlibacter sp.]|nr:hypothetical protein [Ramlibacter sp.]